MWPNVTTGDIASRWRPLTDAEAIVAATRIEDAEVELRSQLRLRGLTEPPAGEHAADWEHQYVRTVADMVRRYLLNPEGWLEEREEIDDWAGSRRRDSAVSAGLIYVDETELERLLPGRRRRGAFSIRLGRS